MLTLLEMTAILFLLLLLLLLLLIIIIIIIIIIIKAVGVKALWPLCPILPYDNIYFRGEFPQRPAHESEWFCSLRSLRLHNFLILFYR